MKRLFSAGLAGNAGVKCGVVARFYWAGEYEAACTKPAGHDPGVGHSDGIAWQDEETKARLGAEHRPGPRASFPVPTVLECDLAKLDELAKANPGHKMPELLRAYALWEIIDEDDAATGYREPGEDDES